MSHPANDQWIEAAYENFTSAVEAGNYELAKAIVEDTDKYNFSSVASAMRSELQNTPVIKFNVTSPYA